MGNFAERTRQLMDERGMTQAELARQVGTKQQTISYLLRGDGNTQSSRYTTKIASVLGVNPLWLQTGEGEPHAPLLSMTQVNLYKDTRQIPIISYKDILKFLSDEPFSTKGYLMSGTNTPAKRFAFEIEDNSMSPTFAPSDVVVVETDLEPRPGDYVVAKTPKNLVLLRKYRCRGDGFELVPENPDWGVTSDSDGTVIVGVMVEHRRYWKR
jgi:SOS-response transcriptional repressor LexA